MGGKRLEGADLTATTRNSYKPRNRPRTVRRMVQPTLDGGKEEARYTCDKVCKNIKGLRIFQAISRCSIFIVYISDTAHKTNW